MQLYIILPEGLTETRSSTPWPKDGTLLQMTMRGPCSLVKGAALVTERSYIVSTNRQAYHDYFVDETIEAGIALTGTEVKSIREGKVNLRGAYARIRDGEVWLENVHIAEYTQGTYMNHAPLRSRKLLLHRREINRLTQRIQAKGQTLVPLKLYFKENRVKVELGLCRGKKLYDKRRS